MGDTVVEIRLQHLNLGFRARHVDLRRGLWIGGRHSLIHRLTSRARAVAVIVGSPQLFEPECHTPRQMQLANALCRYRELATTTPPNPEP